MGFGIHVNVVWDPTLGANFHTYWQTIVPAPLPSTPTPSFEMITTQMWTAGYFLGQNKFTTTVKHRKVPVCIDDHDIGTLIPDITIPFTNLYYTIMWPFSSRKMMFKASTVKMNGKPVSCSQFAPLPLRMMTCGDPFALPLATPLINWLNPLTVGFTLKDFLMGCARILVSLAIDAIFFGLGKYLDKRAAGKAAQEVAEEVAEEIAESAARQVLDNVLPEVAGKLGLMPRDMAKNAVTALADWGFTALEGNPTLKMEILGGPIPKVGVQAGGQDSDFAGAQGEVFGVPVGTVASPPADPLHIVTDP